jgi:hypothetical protein
MAHRYGIPLQVTTNERGEPVTFTCLGHECASSLLPHLAPLGWEHIILTGGYVWQPSRLVERGRLRPLRMRDEA